jgi:L-amino acid N-acyltransferase YncA
MMPDMPTIEELLALDLLTLREHTERAGDKLDPQLHALQLRQSLHISQVCAVRREGELVAYAMLSPESSNCWFVRAFNTHPQHRTSAVMLELFQSFAALVKRLGITELRSNVYKTNRLSMSFHKKLGFRITKENAKGVEFFASVAEMAANPAIERTAKRLRLLSAAHATRPVAGEP